MADKQIIFSAPMILRLLAGEKTQTRRVLKPQPPEGARYSGIHYASYEPSSHFFNCNGTGFKIRQQIEEGDALWVREAWRTFASLESEKPNSLWWYGCGHGAGIMYEADKHGLAITKDGERWEGPRDDPKAFGKLRPPMFMPRWASRITLTVTDVRVERIQDISEADARAEGVLWVPGHGEISRADLAEGYTNYLNCRERFHVLWDSLNEKRGFGWASNPWVAVYEFRAANKNIDALEE